jgi:digeranylgeranylglycerophospholipid reductase
MLVGDAAGHANPLVLEGIRYAIEFGLLAGKIGYSSLQYKSVVDSLREYEVACKRNLEKKINSAIKVQARWLNLTDFEWDREIDIIKDLSIDEFLDFIKSDFTYLKMMKVAFNHPKMIVRQLFKMVLN